MGLSYDSYSATLRDWEPRIYSSPKELANAVADIMEWMETTGIPEEVVFHNRGSVVRTEINRPRAFTMIGIINKLRISRATYNRYRDRGPDWAEIMDKIAEIVEQQAKELTAANLLNAAFMVRELGMADKSEVSGPGGAPLQQVVTYQLPDNGREAPPKVPTDE